MTGFRDLRVLEKVGESGLADVHAALGWSDAGEQHLVAVKRMRPRFARQPELVRAFMKEGCLGRWLRHPNFVEVFGYGRSGGVPFIVIEYLDGVSLRSLAARGPLEPAVVVDIAGAVAGALACLHGALGPSGSPLDLIHGGIALGNVMVTRAGAVKLLDFGATEPERSLGFMSPEQLAGEPLDARTDQFSLGVVLHELLTGAGLFGDGRPPVPALISERRRRVSGGRLARAGVPALLAQVVMKLMSPARQDRFPSCEALAALLERLRADGDPALRLGGGISAEWRRRAR